MTVRTLEVSSHLYVFSVNLTGDSHEPKHSALTLRNVYGGDLGLGEGRWN
jgi:hypothetical protein